MIHKVATFLALTLLSLPASAQDATAPLIIVTPSHGDANIGGANLGVFGSVLANAWFNGRIADDVKEFQQSTGGTNWDDLAASDFACIGVPPGKPCRDVQKFDGKGDELIAKLRSNGVRHAIVVSLFQQFNGVRYRARANLREIDLSDKSPRVQRTLTGIYNSDAPDNVQKADLRDYWTGGVTPVLDQEARTSIRQLRDMLDTLYVADHNDGNAPEGWKDLKPIREMESAGRAHCHGLPCFETKYWAQQDSSHIWLATGSRSADYGWTLISLNPGAALHNANAVIQGLPVLMKNIRD
jgi:hypothetical protein